MHSAAPRDSTRGLGAVVAEPGACPHSSGWSQAIPAGTGFVQRSQPGLKTGEVKSLSCVRLFATLWTIARQAPLSMGFSRQEYWSG